MELTIGISGKRYYVDKPGHSLRAELEQVVDRILKEKKADRFIGYTMLAAGADTIFANLVLQRGMPLRVILPFAAKEYEKDLNENELKDFHRLCSSAELRICDSSPIAGNDRNQRYLAAGIEIARLSAQILFVWDDQPPIGVGGTADLLSYISENRSQKDLYIIRVLPKPKESSIQQRMQKEMDLSDINAINNKCAHDKIWKGSLLFGWLAVVFFAIKTGFQIEGFYGWLLVVLEFASLMVVAFIVLKGIRKKYHLKFLKSRIRAEQLRLAIPFFQTGTSVLPLLVERNDQKLIDFIAEINSDKPGQLFRSKWFTNFIIRELINKQKAYHLSKVKKIGETPEGYELANRAIVVLFFINLLIHFGLSTGHYWHWISHLPAWLHSLQTTLTILLPATYAAIEGVMSFEDWRKIKNHSEFVYNNLKECESDLPGIADLNIKDCEVEQTKVLTAVAKAMINDNLNWQIIVAEKSNYHWVV